MLEQGDYYGYIADDAADVAFGLSSKSKAQQLAIKWTVICKIVGTDDAGSEVVQNVNSEERTQYFLFNGGEAEEISVRELEKIGFNFDFENPCFRDDVYDPAVGVRLRCKHEEYQGKQRERWMLSNGGYELKLEPADKKDVKKLMARYASKAKAAAEKSGSPAAVAAASAAPAPAPEPATKPETKKGRRSPAPPPPAAPAAESEKPKQDLSHIKTKDDAWAHFCDLAEKAGGDPNVGDWTKAVESRGKPESEFTEEDWQTVAAEALPF